MQFDPPHNPSCYLFFYQGGRMLNLCIMNGTANPVINPNNADLATLNRLNIRWVTYLY